jgi:hypothetical protein
MALLQEAKKGKLKGSAEKIWENTRGGGEYVKRRLFYDR